MANLLDLLLRGAKEPIFWGLLLRQAVIWAVPFSVQFLLRRRMDAERRARGWTSLTWAVGILWFSAASMLPFAWVTRSRRGAIAGLLALLYGCALCLVAMALQLVLIGVVNVLCLRLPFFADA